MVSGLDLCHIYGRLALGIASQLLNPECLITKKRPWLKGHKSIRDGTTDLDKYDEEKGGHFWFCCCSYPG